jgi:transcriptional regulator with GAF, ATPase, and Fis domain
MAAISPIGVRIAPCSQPRSVRRVLSVQPKLLALSGPLARSDFPFLQSLSIGRDASNSIRLNDQAVSLHHCSIRQESERFILTDLESDSGTLVNGIPVRERVLDPGDRITVGSSLFAFQMENVSATPSSPVELDDSISSGQTRQLRDDELLYLHPESLAALPPSERLARSLSALLKIGAAINSIRDVEGLAWQLLGVIFEVIPAERGAILLVGDNGEQLCSPIAWDRVSGPDRPVHVGRSLTRRVIEQRAFVLENEAPESDPDVRSSMGPRGSSNSILCVPLIASDHTLGAIYLHSSNRATSFTKEDLGSLAAIAGLAATALENARQFERLGIENRQLRAEVNLQHDMVGHSRRMRDVYQFIERVAPSDSTVLIQGESGTGKELAARAIHNNSRRKERPFVALNCAALTETLLESELFGHEKGAFTSALYQKKGLLEVAEGGSVFLDEVGELPMTLQAKLLRVLQEREFVRVGGTRSIRLDVRFLAASNKDLQKAVREEKFRVDLFHRLNVICLTMPALRERAEDIPSLAEHFVSRFAQRCDRTVRGISPEARTCLLQYDWPGNIRELENAMERAIVIGSSDLILLEDLPEALLDTATSGASSPAKYHSAIRNLKKQLILDAFEQSGGSFTEAAKSLGVHPNYLHRLVRNLDLRLALKRTTGA